MKRVKSDDRATAISTDPNVIDETNRQPVTRMVNF